MNTGSATLEGLAARVRRGDEVAAVELRHQLMPPMTTMARSLMRSGLRDSVLARRVLAVADRLDPDGLARTDERRDQVAPQVARHLADTGIDRLRAGVPPAQALRGGVRV